MGADSYHIVGSEDRRWQHTSVEPLLGYLKQEVFAAFMRARPDLYWLHASVVERSGRAILISGASGVGKSTLALELVDRGWRLLSDDIAPITATRVLPFFQGATRRVMEPGTTTVREVQQLERRSVHVDQGRISLEPAEIAAIVFPQFSAGADAELDPITPGAAALELLRNLTNFVDHGDDAVEWAGQFASAIPAYFLRYDNALTAAKTLDSLSNH
jgi:hypothetical protein